MKGNAILRIVLFSLAILVLISILGSILLLRSFVYDVKESGVIEVVNDVLSIDETGEVRIDGNGLSGEYDASKIRDVKIEWVSGSIIVQTGNTDIIRFEESAVSDPKYQMVVKRSGDKLTLMFCDENVINWGFGVNIDTNISKDLVITVPQDWACDTLEIDTASARVEISDLQLNEVDFDGASGLLILEDCEIMTLDIDTASGDVEFSGILNELDFDAASAKFDGEFYQTPNRLDLDAMSGDMTIVLPEDSGFILDLDTMSGTFESNFQFTTSGNQYRCGNGSCGITVSSMSGDISILKGSNGPAENRNH